MATSEVSVRVRLSLLWFLTYTVHRETPVGGIIWAEVEFKK